MEKPTDNCNTTEESKKTAAEGKPDKGPVDPEKKAMKDAHKKEREEEKRKKNEAFAKKQEEKKKKEEEDKKKKEQAGVQTGGEAQKEKKEKEKDKKQPDGEKGLRLKKHFDNKTPVGHKKDTSQPLANEYDPPAVEAAWYDWWVAKAFFHADNKSPKEKFTIVIPPPNVTGALHIGHALTNAIQDALVRWHRMQGRCALWVPGTDHAGIATQTAVEKMLKRTTGKTRHDLGREAFVAEVWKWKEQYGTRICDQLRRLGGSYDWARECFTMDAKLSKAVTEAFVQLFNRGLMYRESRLVNWVCALNTAIADIEMVPEELKGPTKLRVPGYDELIEFGVLTLFAYPVEGGGEIVVGTTRVETMLADTAVAIHPDDERYKQYHGKHVVHPFSGARLPLVCDPVLVDMKFGTGAVKVTPAHDPNDYECGKRNNLAFVNLLNDDGTINANGGKFAGMKRYYARQAVLDALKEKGLLRGSQPNPMVLQRCDRSTDIIEPLIKPQWYVRCAEMGARCVKAVADGELQILPASKVVTWNRWLENIRDWCVSRQLWWGHRIPAYVVHVKGRPAPDHSNTEHWVVGRTHDEALAAAAAKFGVPASDITLAQDEDVLDTWFSSALFPFSVFGWPEKTEDLAAFYPTSLLETGEDILFFWVARMVMMGLTLTDKLPFKQVLLHQIVRDAQGDKMSKSKGNVVDPIDVIEGVTLETLLAGLHKGNLKQEDIAKATEGMKKNFPEGIPECGTDAIRFGLAALSSQETSINLDPRKIVAYRKFCNKIWNAVRFTLAKLGADYVPPASAQASGHEGRMDQWIRSRLARAIDVANKAFAALRLGDATDAIHRFWWDEFCSVYLESIKPVFQKADTPAERVAACRNTLFKCVDEGLRLLHPFMPFVTEELWQHLPGRHHHHHHGHHHGHHHHHHQLESICVAPYPTDASERNEPREAEVERALATVNVIRSPKTAYNLVDAQRPPAYLCCQTDEQFAALSPYAAEIAVLACAGGVTPLLRQAAPTGCAVSILDPTLEVHLNISDLIDPVAEIARLEKALAKSRTDIQNLQKKMASPGYDKVPADVREKNAKTLADQQAAIVSNEAAVAKFQALKAQREAQAKK